VVAAAAAMRVEDYWEGGGRVEDNWEEGGSRSRVHAVALAINGTGPCWGRWDTHTVKHCKAITALNTNTL